MSSRRPEFQIPAQPNVFIRAANALVRVFPKNNRTGIRDSIPMYKVVAAFLLAVGAIVCCPPVLLVFTKPRVYEAIRAIIQRNPPRPAISESGSWLGFKSLGKLL